MGKKNRWKLIELFHFDRHISVDSSLPTMTVTVNVIVCSVQCRVNRFPVCTTSFFP